MSGNDWSNALLMASFACCSIEQPLIFTEAFVFAPVLFRYGGGASVGFLKIWRPKLVRPLVIYRAPCVLASAYGWNEAHTQSLGRSGVWSQKSIEI
jgi:hypothetical protein